MGFDPDQQIVAGTVLIRSDIRSQNYVAGSSGWIIEADGDAEFNDVNVRGSLEVLGDNNAYTRIIDNGGKPDIIMQPRDYSDGTTPPPNAAVFEATSVVTPDHRGILTLTGPGQGGAATISLSSPSLATETGPTDSKMNLFAYLIEIGGLPSSVTTVDGTLSYTTLKAGTRDVGRGLVVRASSNADATGFTTTEIVLLSAASATFAANRAFRVVHNARYTNSAGTANFPVLGFRKGTTTAGQALVDAGRQQMPASTLTFGLGGDFVFTTGASPVTTQISMTGATTPAGVTVTQRGAANLGRYFEIYDIGDAADFPDTVVLV